MAAEEIETVRWIKDSFTYYTRPIGLLALYFSLLTFTASYYTPRRDVFIQNLQCPHPKYDYMVSAERVMHNSLINDYFKQYKLFEYVTDGSCDTINEKKKICDGVEEIPVLIFPGLRGGSADHLFVVKTVTDRTKNSTFRFRFYGFEFGQKSLEYSHPLGTSLKLFMQASVVFLQERYPTQRLVRICHSVGGITGFGLLVHYYHTDQATTKNLTDLVILESSPMAYPGYYEKDQGKLYEEYRNQWNTNETRLPVGVVYFDAGFDDTTVDSSWLGLQNVTRIPVWAIDGVPDNGFTKLKMLICKPYVDHVADLLIAYGEKHNRATGKEIVKSFYDEWESKKQGPLPIGWKKDIQEGSFKVETSVQYYHNILVNGTRWIDFSLKRGESIAFNVSGSCLSAATLIRNRKFIQRKDKLIDSYHIGFGVFQVKPFEDVKLFLESSQECFVSLETSTFMYAHTLKFYDGWVVDPHYFWVAAHLVSNFLFILENDKRSYRLEHQLYLYILFIASFLYHIYSTFGVPQSGLICGAGFSISVHFICNTIDHVYNQFLMTNFDFPFYTRLLRNYFYHIILVLFLTRIFSAAICVALTFTCVYSWSSRAFLGPPTILTHLPILYSAFYTPLFIRHGPIVSFAFSALIVVLAYGFFMFRTHVRRVPGASMFAPFPTRFLSRSEVHQTVYPLFCLQVLWLHLPLEVHYAIGFLVLTIDRSSIHYIPNALRTEPLDLIRLEEEYERLETCVRSRGNLSAAEIARIN